MERNILFVAFLMAVLLAVTPAWGESTPVLLEKGIFAEETSGDLDKAITIYEQIISENNASRSYVARAYYRLGACYLKKGDGVKAAQAFKDLIDHFQDQEEWVAEAKTQLAQLGIQENGLYVDQKDAQSLKIVPAPWKTDEVCYYKLQTPAGVDIGNIIWTADSAKFEGRDVWRIEQYLTVLASNATQYSRVDADKDSFAPVWGRTKSPLGDFRAAYGRNSVNLVTDVSGNRAQKDIPVDQVVYDNEQALYLMRRLPLEEGYKASFPVFPVQNGILVQCEIHVTGIEKVEVPAGTFDCHRVSLAIIAGDVKALQATVWFSADEDRVPVKYDSEQTIIVLSEVTHKQAGVSAEFTNEALGVTVTAPESWYFCEAPSLGNSYTLFLEILSPEMQTQAYFTINKTGESNRSVRAIADQDIKVLKNAFEGYAVRPESWAEDDISGLPSAGFTADYKDKGRDMVEYRDYILGESYIYWFTFRIEADAFQAYKFEFDEIIQSFIGR